MADCKSCHWAGVDWADNIVCGCPAATDPVGDCPEYEAAQHEVDACFRSPTGEHVWHYGTPYDKCEFCHTRR